MDQAKIAANASAPVKDLLSTMRAMLDSEEADEPKMTTERAEASQSRSNKPNDSRQPQHQHKNETVQPRGTNTTSNDVPKAPRSSTRSVAPAPPRNEGHPRANPIQRSTRDNPPPNGPAVPVCLEHLISAIEQMLQKSKFAILFDMSLKSKSNIGFNANRRQAQVFRVRTRSGFNRLRRH